MTFADPNFTRPQDLLTYVDSVTQGIGFEVLLVVILVVAYYGLLSRGNTNSQAFTGAMFFVTIIAGIMLWLELIGFGVIGLCLTLLVFSIVAVWHSNNQ